MPTFMFFFAASFFFMSLVLLIAKVLAARAAKPAHVLAVEALNAEVSTLEEIIKDREGIAETLAPMSGGGIRILSRGTGRRQESSGIFDLPGFHAQIEADKRRVQEMKTWLAYLEGSSRNREAS